MMNRSCKSRAIWMKSYHALRCKGDFPVIEGQTHFLRSLCLPLSLFFYSMKFLHPLPLTGCLTSSTDGTL